MATKTPTLRELLNKIAEENNYSNYKIDIVEFLSGGANITSKLYTAVIKGSNKDDLHIFAKVCVIGENNRKGMPPSFFYAEHFCYTTLWKTYRALEEEYGLQDEDRMMFTKSYGFDLTMGQETAFLENLSAQEYKSFDRHKSVDWKYAASAVTNLAKLHSLSFAYHQNNPEEFNSVLSYLKKDWQEAALAGFERCGQAKALKYSQPEHQEPLERYLRQRLRNVLVNSFAPTSHPVLIHADYKPSNLMHRVREDGSVDIKIVDLQTLQGGSPVTDLLYFIFTGSDEKFRAEYYDKLIDHYYAELSAALKRLHLNPDEIYSRQHFDQELQEKLPFGLALAVFTLPVITVDTDKAPKVNESMEITDFSVSNTSALYKERLNGVINDYVRWGVLK